MLETHPDPEHALSDAGQALHLDELNTVIADMQAIHTLLQKSHVPVA